MKKVNRYDILDIIKNQGGGVVSVNNDIIALIAGCTRRTVDRALKDLENEGLIQRQTKNVKTNNGRLMARRYIIITDPNHPHRGFSVEEHMALSRRSNHRCKRYSCGTVEWLRKPALEWEVSMPSKEFRDCKHVWEYIHYAIAQHKRMAKGNYSIIDM